MEYPKALYLAGVQLVAQNSREEDVARTDGFDDWHADHARTTAAAESIDVVEDTPDPRHLANAEAHLIEMAIHLQAKEDELTAREQAVAAREAALAEAEAARAAPLEDVATGAQPPTRDELKARAAEIGIEHAPNITTDKLAALVAGAQG